MLTDIFTDYTLRTVAMGASLLGLVSGILGSFAVLRKQSLMGDAISHAALPGIAVAFLITGSKATLILLLGAAIAGWLGMVKVIAVIRHTRIKEESALGIVLSVFFGFGIVLLTFIQRLPTANKAGLDTFLFGQAATLMMQDVLVMALLGIPAILVVLLLWKELKILSFDRDFAATAGFPVQRIEILLTTLIVIGIVIGLQTVGVVLMSAMIVAPAAAARQWTDRLGSMVALSALFGDIAGVTGAIVSATTAKLPTGPTIVVAISGIVLISLLFAPKRGMVWAHLREQKNRHQLQLLAVLEDMYLLSTQHEDPLHAHPRAVLQAMSVGHGGVDRTLTELEHRGLAKRIEGWALTPRGLEEAQLIASNWKSKQEASPGRFP